MSFSPNFEKIAALGDKEVEPQHIEPYAKRADPSKPAKTLSPGMRNNWIITPASSMKNVTEAKKEEIKRRKSVLTEGLPLFRKQERSFQLLITGMTTSADEQQQAAATKIDVLQEDHKEDEEEKLAPTPVASFLAKETGDEKFPWAFVNAETGLELAFYKHKSTDFGSHLEQSEALKKIKPVDLELYGKTPLYENQKYRKKGPESQEIIYHWASTKIRHPTKILGLNVMSGSIEMSTKHETPEEFKLIKGDGGSSFVKVLDSSKKEVAVGEIMTNDDGIKMLRLTIQPKVDPTLIIVFLAMTKTLTPFTIAQQAN
mmetsp:Transcript_39933/g.96351  ORF Transcript_39933/g.96351 Transcript_39933/m.96351 type:complete len:315 (-) Transcript_39933:213-1157(-)